MDVVQMRYFLQVCEDGKISRAAEHLYVSPQYLSRVMQKLEDELGAPLFCRSHRGLTLTPEGEKAFRRIRAMLEEYRALQGELQSGGQRTCGRIRVAMDVGLTQLLLARPVGEFARRYPDVELMLKEHRIFNCKKLVLQHRVDLGLSICIDWNEALSCRKLRALRAEVLLPETHALAGRKSLRLADLCGERLLFEGCPAYYTFLQEFERAAREPQIVTAINDPQAVLSYVQAGMGICPVVYAPGRGAAQLPRGVRAVPYESGSEIALYAYWDGEEPGELEALFLQQLERSLP